MKVNEINLQETISDFIFFSLLFFMIDVIEEPSGKRIRRMKIKTQQKRII